jgi:acetylornithine deacetylase/succinyl-diaminopimelate desuccinylase-like protein
MRAGVVAPLLAMVVVSAGLGGVTSAQRAGAVDALMQDARVSAALQAARDMEPRTLDDQVRFCEVPAPPFGEAPRGQVLRQAFVDAGLRNVRVDAVGNVIGDRPGRSSRPRLVVAAHLDTVFPEGTKTNVMRNGATLTGPGIGDNCRGLAVLVAIVRSLDAAAVQTTGPVTFVANVGEEGLGDLRGVRALFDDTLSGRIDRFVSIDNADLAVSAIGVGSRRYRVTFKGPGGHSFADFGLPSPANALGRAVARLADLRVSPNPRTTFNVGRIGGGTSVNAIPTEAWMEVDLRSAQSAALADLDARFQRIVDQAVSEENARWGAAGRITVEKQLVGDRPAGSVPRTAPIVQTAEAVARALEVPVVPSEASSDANLPLSRGIPAIAIGGGGRSFGSHTPAESFDATDSWKGTQYAVLLTVALAEQ